MQLTGNRVAQLMKGLREKDKRSLSVCVTLGDPTFETSILHVDDAVEAGVNMVELCIPSPTPNPFLDSPSLLASMKRSAIHYRGSFEPYFEIISKIRQRHPELPIESMCYQDVMNRLGINQFVETLHQVGVDSALFSADMSTKPIDIRRQMTLAFSQNGIVPVQFVPHPFRPAQISELFEIARGFVTVQTKAEPDNTRQKVQYDNKYTLDSIRAGGINLPLILAYGIRTPEHIRTCMDLGADGVMIGTAVLDAGFQFARSDFRALLQSYRQAAAA